MKWEPGTAGWTGDDRGNWRGAASTDVAGSRLVVLCLHRHPDLPDARACGRRLARDLRPAKDLTTLADLDLYAEALLFPAVRPWAPSTAEAAMILGPGSRSKAAGTGASPPRDTPAPTTTRQPRQPRHHREGAHRP